MAIMSEFDIFIEPVEPDFPSDPVDLVELMEPCGRDCCGEGLVAHPAKVAVTKAAVASPVKETKDFMQTS